MNTEAPSLPLARAAAQAIEDGRMDDVLRLLAQAGDDPQSAQVPLELGTLLLGADAPHPASFLLALAAERAPRFATTWMLLGHAFRRRNAPVRAAGCYRRAMALAGESAEALYNLGESLLAMDDIAGGRQALLRAEALQPAGMTRMALANLNRHCGHYREAADYFRAALDLLSETSAEAKYCHTMLGITALLVGDHANGWREYEWRLSHARATDHERWCALFPHWDGTLRRGLRLVVHCEQGLGDTLQFVRYCPWLRRHGVEVTLVLQRSLTTLLERQLPPLADRVLAEGDPLPAADAHVSLLSLPARLMPHWGRMEFLPAPYLTAAPDRTAEARAQLSRLAGGRPAMGVAWAGNPNYPHDTERSLRHEQLAPLLDQDAVALFSLQLGPERAKWLAAPHGRMIDLGDQLSDFDATAAWMAALDGVVTVDSAPAHLAGALGRPVAVLLPVRNDFRWGLAPATGSQWYPSMRLYRQDRDGDWTSVLMTLAHRLGSGTAFDTPCPSAQEGV